MTITYTLAPNPKWYIADLVGRPLGGGYLATFRSLPPQQIKLVYEDPAGVFPWPYVIIPNVGSMGILFDENGSQGPFYWEFDSANPEETYYLEVYDANGILQWTVDDFTPPSGGGGSIITEAIDLENIIVNNIMWRNTGSTPISTSEFMVVAPGAHAGLSQTASNAGPDICFIKNNLNAIDTIAFPKFNLGSTPFMPDVTPYDYLEYTCSNAPTGEIQKCFQFPITKNIQNLGNQVATVTIWAQYRGGTGTLTLQWRQFFGDGGSPSPDVITVIDTLPLSNEWEKFVVTTTIPSALNSPPYNLGDCGNDALFLQVQMPLDVITIIDFTKPSVYLNNISPDIDYHTYDMIDGIINAPRTGYVFGSYDLIAPRGYLAMGDGTIGSSASGATNAGTYTFPLYNWLWMNVSNPSSNAWCPVTGGLGASAVVDFVANKPLALPLALGRTFAGAGTGAGLTDRILGQYLGSETISIAAMPAHNHPGSTVATTDHSPTFSPISHAMGTDVQSGTPTLALSIATQGSGEANGNISPTSFLNYFIKL